MDWLHEPCLPSKASQVRIPLEEPAAQSRSAGATQTDVTNKQVHHRHMQSFGRRSLGKVEASVLPSGAKKLEASMDHIRMRYVCPG